jgi:hypothetical protein
VKLGEKKLFIRVAAGGILALVAIAGLVWYLISPRLNEFYPGLPAIVGAATLLAAFVIAVGLLIIALSALTGRRILFSHRITGTVVRVLFPPVLMLAGLMSIERDRVKRSFIAVNNALVMAGQDSIRGGKLLLLLPHCLQATDCPHKITGGLIENCRGCGKCVIAGLLSLANEYGISLVVATGGTLARRVIVEERPVAIIAVACETDLTSGIRDSYPLPVYGVLNERPNGPCRDTTVALDTVRDAMQLFTGDDSRVRPEEVGRP